MGRRSHRRTAWFSNRTKIRGNPRSYALRAGRVLELNFAQMDVARPPEVAQRRKRNRIIAGAGVAVLVLVTTVALSRLRPAAPTVEAGGLWIEPVKRGTMVRRPPSR